MHLFQLESITISFHAFYITFISQNRYVTLWRHYDVNSARKIGNIFFLGQHIYMFPLENEYKSRLPQNAHGTYKAACTNIFV